MRQWAVEDAPNIRALYNDPKVHRYFPWSLNDSEEEAVNRIKRNLTNMWEKYDHGMMAVSLHANGHFIGSCGLLHWELDGREETEVAYSIIPDAWGHGYATEAARALAKDAFRRLNRDRVISMVHPANIASINVALNNGMHFERRTKLFDCPVNVYAKWRDAAQYVS